MRRGKKKPLGPGYSFFLEQAFEQVVSHILDIILPRGGLKNLHNLNNSNPFTVCSEFVITFIVPTRSIWKRILFLIAFNRRSGVNFQFESHYIICNTSISSKP